MKNIITRKYLLGMLFIGFSIICPAQDYIIHAGHLIQPGTGEVTKDHYIWISQGRIKALAQKPSGDWQGERIDLRDSWVMPGLIDCHTHISLNFPYGDFDMVSKSAGESNAMRALIGLKTGIELLRGGFTTIREVGNDGNYAVSDVKKAFDRDWFPGPTIVYSGKIIAPYGGQMTGISPDAGNPWEYEYLIAESPEEMIKAIHQNIYYGGTSVKLVTDDQPYYYSQEMIAAAVTEAHRLGMIVTVHTLGNEAARNVILGGADGIDHGFDLNQENLELMKQQGTFLIGTDFTLDHIVASGILDELGGRILSQVIVERLKMAYKLGVKMAFGSDVVINLQGKDRLASTLAILESWEAAGIPPMEVLKCMTNHAAELLHMENVRGDIQPGLAADIIALNDNPLDELSNLQKVNFVMKEGRVIRNDH